MVYELTKYNIDVVKKALEDVNGKAVYINDVGLYGVKSIDIETSVMYDGDPDPETGYDGGKRDMIDLTFNFEKGSAKHSFCPDTEHCGISFETDDLWIFNILDLKKYIENQMFELNYRLGEYDKFMAK